MNKFNYLKLANKIWPNNIWIVGEGKYASVSFCNVYPTVILHCDILECIDSIKIIDNNSCGGKCAKKHMLVYIDDIVNKDGSLRN